jgi:hypothetical protein
LPSITWETDFPRALRLARELGRLVLVDFYSLLQTGCAEMQQTTYQDDDVVAAVMSGFVPVRIQVPDGIVDPPDNGSNCAWGPTIWVVDSDGTELYRWDGVQPPAEFLPRLMAAEASAYLSRGESWKARAIYREMLRRYPTSVLVPEALYYLAISEPRPSSRDSGADSTGGSAQAA